jgi:cyclopropane fatty-acyl-phospholipid synthase-like methyltransferase
LSRRLSQTSLPPRTFGYWEYYRELDYLNPTSPDILLQIGRAAGLNPDSRVLDVGSGKGAVAILWAEHFGCSVLGVDNLPEMTNESRQRAADSNVADFVEFRTLNATTIDRSITEHFDVVSCMGAMFIWGFLEGLQRLTRLVAPGGSLVYADIVYTERPVDPDFLQRSGYLQDEFPTLPQLQEYLRILGWEITHIWEAGKEEWSRYLKGTGKALKWYNNLHPFNDNPFVKAEEDWTRSLEETNRKWIRFIHAVIKERR